MATAHDVELLVVRHGITSWNLERRYQGQRDIELLFPEAEPGLVALKAALEGERVDAIYVSDLTRCRQTLEWVKPPGAARVYIEPRLRELDFGEFEGKVYDELKALAHYRAWIDSAGELKIPGGESAGELRARLNAWLAEVAINAREQRHEKVLVVTHGGVIRELRRRFEDAPFWEATVAQATGRRWALTYCTERGEWQCNFSSAVPAPARKTL
ncbi:histidine phosphatase family protein [Vreelandella malpeensis]|uniref:Histidine phosphatase family protein n=1 Tax=Vreelandella malpeensis TaxID=1172368 RepID=A0ABS8DV88_9GAMM|nr:histidine phosphatase family protein [Halomonas malpeensis]MCB8890217.1 histidine phosphatase family protein [Halomonas malpeensis]